MPHPPTRLQPCLHILVLLLILEPGTAFAYLDPNTGGLIFQILAPVFAVLAGFWFALRRVIAQAVKNAWNRLKSQRGR